MDQDGYPSSPIRAATRRTSDCPPLDVTDNAVASGSGSGIKDMSSQEQVLRPRSRQTRRMSSSNTCSRDYEDDASDCASGPSDATACKRTTATTSEGRHPARPLFRRGPSMRSKMVQTVPEHSPNRCERNQSAMKVIIQDLMVTAAPRQLTKSEGSSPTTERPLTARTRQKLNRQHFDTCFPPPAQPASWTSSSSTTSSTTESSPSSPRSRRRKRANSVPLIPLEIPASKRRRTKADRLSPSPSESQAFSCQVTVACKTPPINLQSMHSLDARHVLQDPQIRHDGLFDSIGFLPASSIHHSTTSTPSGTMSVDPQLAREARIRDITSEMYWESVGAEFKDGCRCTRWVVPKDDTWPHGLAIDRRVRLRDCICGKWMRDQGERQWIKAQGSSFYASRLPALFMTLRQIIESLMGSTAALPSQSPVAGASHPLVSLLLSQLEPEHLTLQVRRGVECAGMFQVLGEVMKLHCAPVRDAMVDAMVQLAKTATASDPAGLTAALAKSFDCLEIMKLDIVNHQIRAMRPYLWREAPLNEMASFHQALASKSLSLQTSKTRGWIRAASERVLRRAPASQRIHLLGKCSCARRSDLAAETMAEAFIELVMADWTGDSAWPPSVHRKGKQPAVDSGIGNVELPESLQFDARRLRAFNAQTIDIAMQQAVLLGCQHMMRTRTPSVAPQDIAARLVAISADIRAAIHHTNSPLTAVLPSMTLQIAYRMAGLDPSSVTEVRSLGDRLELNRLAEAVHEMILRDTARSSPVFAACQTAIRRYLSVMLTHDLFAVRFDAQSTLYDLESALLTCEHQQQPASSSSSNKNNNKPVHVGDKEEPAVSPARAAKGLAAAQRAQKDAILSVYQQAEATELSRLQLAALKPQLHDLLRRMVDIACFNFAIFKHVYLAKGMMLGA